MNMSPSSRRPRGGPRRNGLLASSTEGMRSVVGTPMMRTTEPKKDIQSESADRAPAREYGNVEDEEGAAARCF